jgi:hypothetical protein
VFGPFENHVLDEVRNAILRAALDAGTGPYPHSE